MPVRKTESRIPDGFTADNLGQNAAATGNADIILISFLSSPLAVRRLQNYVVIIKGAATATIGANVTSYDWTFTNGAATTRTTTNGITEFTPQNTGTLTVSVNLKNSANTVLN